MIAPMALGYFMACDVKGVLLDMDGVLYVGNELLEGACDTIEWLRAESIPFRFITNTTTRTKRELMEKLAGIGIEAKEDELFTAVSATRAYLQKLGSPSCHLLVRDSVRESFAEFPCDDHEPDVVVIGDIGASWTYDNLNAAFNMLVRGAELVCMHRNKYWQDSDGLRMDIGAFVAALEYVSGKRATVIGKPAPTFFDAAVRSLDLLPEEVAIVGDDIESDIGGGQDCGLRGVLCETGKYRPEIVENSGIRPNARIDSIAELPDWLSEITS